MAIPGRRSQTRDRAITRHGSAKFCKSLSQNVMAAKQNIHQKNEKLYNYTGTVLSEIVQALNFSHEKGALHPSSTPTVTT